VKRRILKLALFLLLGAIVNVAVAWGCAVFSEVSPAWARSDRYINGWMRPRLTIPPQGSVHYYGTVDGGFGRTRLSAELRDESTAPRMIRTSYLFIHRDGWPARAIQGESMSGEHFAPRRLRHAAQIPTWLERGGLQTRFPFSHVLGLRPIWLGFAFNTIFYTAILWLPFAPFRLQRYLRLKRGHCIKCGYDLRGNSGGSGGEVCPECGRGQEVEV